MMILPAALILINYCCVAHFIVPLFVQQFPAAFVARIRLSVLCFFAVAAWNTMPSRLVAVQECDAIKV